MFCENDLAKQFLHAQLKERGGNDDFNDPRKETESSCDSIYLLLIRLRLTNITSVALEWFYRTYGDRYESDVF